MNLQELQSAIRDVPGDLPLVFETEQGPIGRGYHVTELKLSHIESIDCGARTDSWKETTLQLLDGAGESHMVVDTFRQIATQSIERLDGLGVNPLKVEFAHGNKGMQVFAPARPEVVDGAVKVRLDPVRALCKPALKMIGGVVADGCCPASQQDQPEPDVTENPVEAAVTSAEQGCCGGPAPEGVDACCVKDANAKADGQSGCGCNDAATTMKASQPCCG